MKLKGKHNFMSTSLTFSLEGLCLTLYTPPAPAHQNEMLFSLTLQNAKLKSEQICSVTISINYP